MGSLVGHVLPGSFFLLFALWRIIQIPIRLGLLRLVRQTSMSHRKNDRETYFTSATYPCCVAICARFPVEGVTKILVTGIGMGGELWASTDYGRAGRVKFMGDIQHVTMYALFCLSGIVDVLCWKRVRFCPPGLDFLALANAFVGEWVLFSNHLHGQDPLEVLLHRLLLIVIAATVLTIALEFIFNKSLVASLATSYLLCVQGTWFIQVGVILYKPMRWTSWLKFDLDEHDQVTMAMIIFAWHMGADFIILTLLFVLVRFLAKFCCRPDVHLEHRDHRLRIFYELYALEKLWEAHRRSSSLQHCVTVAPSTTYPTADDTDDAEQDSEIGPKSDADTEI